MGVSTHSIKHYEKFRLVHPHKDDTTNYRYYDLSQYARIIECRKFRNIGVPIKDISLLLNDSNNNEFNEILEDHISDLDSQIKTLLHQKSLLRLYIIKVNTVINTLMNGLLILCLPYTF